MLSMDDVGRCSCPRGQCLGKGERAEKKDEADEPAKCEDDGQPAKKLAVKRRL